MRQRQRIIALEREVRNLQLQSGELMEEQKQLQLKNQQLEEKVKRLEMRIFDTGMYESWGWEEILQWIMCIDDGRFSKYEPDLRKSLQEEEPSGSDLVTVNTEDIKRWGIKKFSDIKLLSENIKQLSGKDNHNHNQNIAVANNEGNISGGHFR